MARAPESYMPPRLFAEFWEKVRRRAFLVRERTKLKVKIKGVLAYKGVKPPEGHGLSARQSARKVIKQYKERLRIDKKWNGLWKKFIT